MSIVKIKFNEKSNYEMITVRIDEINANLSLRQTDVFPDRSPKQSPQSQKIDYMKAPEKLTDR